MRRTLLIIVLLVIVLLGAVVAYEASSRSGPAPRVTQHGSSPYAIPVGHASVVVTHNPVHTSSLPFGAQPVTVQVKNPSGQTSKTETCEVVPGLAATHRLTFTYTVDAASAGIILLAIDGCTKIEDIAKHQQPASIQISSVPAKARIQKLTIIVDPSQTGQITVCATGNGLAIGKQTCQ